MKKNYLFIAVFVSALTISAQSYQVLVSEADEPMATGQFTPDWNSLRTYEVPDWFRDAKFGIWAHWGPQCVEGSGDWMARELYMEGNGKANYHRQHYGHPSEFGFKDILPLFKAENWNPEELVKFYKEVVGAQYFFALGNHHDNFDLWDSKYQEWNSKAIGPHKDILDGWSKAAKKAGLPFGVSFHADHAWTWYEPSRRFDLKGPMRGVKYDGWLTKEDGYKPNADGTEKWWKGLDPQKLYAQDHDFSNNTWDNGAIHSQWGWQNGANIPTREYITNFYNRCLDAINRYNPDLIYFDVTVLPFYPISDAGMKIATHMYNHSAATHGGKNQAVVFGKILRNLIALVFLAAVTAVTILAFVFSRDAMYFVTLAIVVALYPLLYSYISTAIISKGLQDSVGSFSTKPIDEKKIEEQREQDAIAAASDTSDSDYVFVNGRMIKK